MSTNSGKGVGSSLSRRGFAGTSAAALGLFATAAPIRAAQHETNDREPIIQKGATVLFQGDSITDASRNRAAGANANDPAGLGKGYAWLTAAELLVERPEDGLKIFNRGVSGNKVYQLAERWQADCLDLKPDVLSILIGVNDIWHALNGNYQGTVEKYEKDYRALLDRTKKALPEVKLVICEPFVLRCGAVNDKWFPEFDKYRAAAKRIAEDFKAVFVPFQEMFDRASKIAPPERWAADGVHPTSDGASLMARWWLQAVA
jgi:lysophospholipase L1-like esterase